MPKLEATSSASLLYMAWQPGHQLQGGKYIIEQMLGEGGFGVTYKAKHTLLNSLVVIKTPNDRLKNDPEYFKYVKRFRKEAELLGQLSLKRHPHIVQVKDLFEENTLPCLVMEFIAGENLFSLVEQQGALPEIQATNYFYQIGEALNVVHEVGLVHRDAHPGNIMLIGNHQAVLIDFGLAGQIVPKALTSKGAGF